MVKTRRRDPAPPRGSAFEAAAAVPDPELPSVTIAELGILREAVADGDAAVVTITPTYSGCPAMDVIRADIAAALREAGYTEVEIHTVYAPAWTTDWITAEGRAKLEKAGVAPPGAMNEHSAPPASDLSGGGERSAPPGERVEPRRALPLLSPSTPTCPGCRSRDVEEISRFGSTACMSLWRCRSCTEPFPHMKAH